MWWLLVCLVCVPFMLCVVRVIEVVCALMVWVALVVFLLGLFKVYDSQCCF